MTVRWRVSYKPCITSHYTKSSPGDHKSFPGPLMATGAQGPHWKQHKRLWNVPSLPHRSTQAVAVFSPCFLSVGETFSRQAAQTGSQSSPLLPAVFNDPPQSTTGLPEPASEVAKSEMNCFIITTAFCRIQKHTLWFLPRFGRFVVGEIEMWGFFKLKLNAYFFF